MSSGGSAAMFSLPLLVSHAAPGIDRFK